MSYHMKRNSKEKNQRYHAKMRMLQHYGVSISYADLEKMAEIFRHDPDTAILSKRSNRLTKAVIAYKGICYPIVYDSSRHQLVTILKSEYLSPKQKQIFDSCQFRQNNKQLDNVTKVLPNVFDLVAVDEENIVVVEDESAEQEIEDSETEDEKLMREAFERL